jgi:catechol 2,3-dioxygenase-like lactoylglutathione lyase family enzyme
MDIDHLTIPVRDYETGKRFYAELLAPLGFQVLLDWPDRRRAYLGIHPRPSSLWVVESPFAGAVDISLAVADRGEVAAFHSAAIAAGGKSIYEPSVRPEHNVTYYAARIMDFDGNSIEAVHRTAAAAERAAA